MRHNYHPNANTEEIAAQKSIAAVDHGHGGRRQKAPSNSDKVPADSPPIVDADIAKTQGGLEFGMVDF